MGDSYVDQTMKRVRIWDMRKVLVLRDVSSLGCCVHAGGGTAIIRWEPEAICAVRTGAIGDFKVRLASWPVWPAAAHSAAWDWAACGKVKGTRGADSRGRMAHLEAQPHGCDLEHAGDGALGSRSSGTSIRSSVPVYCGRLPTDSLCTL